MTQPSNLRLVTEAALATDLAAYLTETDAASTYLTETNAASTYLTKADAASTYQPTIADTGWVNVSYLSGFTAGTPGQLQYRIIGDVCYVRGGATGTFPSAAYTEVAVLPSVAVPTVTLRGGAAVSGAGAGLWQISAGSGQVLLGWRDLSNTPPWVGLNASYPLG